MLSQNLSPYFNDYNPLAGHLQVLFKPSVAVQTREVNELQTILQNQISSFGNNIFQPGAMVLPGHLTLDLKYAYVQLSPLNSTQIQQLTPVSGTNLYVYGTSGLKAQVLQIVPALGSNPDTIYVKYLNSGGTGATAGTIKQFSAGEVLSLTQNGVQVTTVSTTSTTPGGPTGFGSAVNISQGIFYVYGYFVQVTSQSIILDMYDNTPSYRIGLTILETDLTANQDPDLNDNAAGSPNYAAPGADRYVITLTLSSLPIGSTNDTTFLQLMQVENGTITQMVTSTAYNVIEKQIAQRTSEINGDFSINPFKIDVRENLLDSTHPLGVYTPAEGGNISLLAVGLEPGLAYVNGYRLQNLVINYVNVPKAQTTAQTVNGVTQATMGNYIMIDKLYGFPTYDDIRQIQLYNAPISTNGTAAGTQIGTAYIRGVEYNTGTISNGSSTFPYPVYLFYVFGISLTGSYTLSDVQSFYLASQTVGANASTGNVISQVILQNATAAFASGTVITDGVNSEKIISYDSSTGITLLEPVSGTIANGTYISGDSINAYLTSRVKLFNTGNNVLIYQLPNTVISTIRSSTDSVTTNYTIKKTFTQITSSTTATFTAASEEAFAPFDVTQYILTVEDSTGAAGTIIPTSISNVSFGPGSSTITFNNIPSGTHTIKLSAPVFREIAQERSKTLVNNSGSPLVLSGPFASTLPLSQVDIYQIISITEIPVSGPNIDWTNQYTLDNGQRDNYYGPGYISLIAGNGPASTSQLSIQFSYFTHGSGEYFSVDSYNNFDGTENWYSNIPTYGQYTLRDCFDFRPVMDTNGTTFTGDSPHGFVQANTDVVADYQYYLARTDLIYVDYQGNFRDLQGIPSLNPVPPNNPKNGMVLYILALNPYTFSNTDLSITTVQNNDYTMYDIGLLEQRIANLETAVSLSLLEQNTANLQVIDSSTGLPLTSNGFVVDNFQTNSEADLNDGDYRVAMDFANGIMRPMYNMKNIDLVFNQANSSNFEFQTLKPNCPLITCSYTEEALITQPYASGVENLNPYAIYSWIGFINLTPSSDTWFDTTTLPAVNVTNNSQYTSVLNALTAEGALGTVWNAWQTDWTGVQTSSTTATGPTLSTGGIVQNDVPISSSMTQAQIDAAKEAYEGTPVLYGTTTPITTTTTTTTTTQQTRTGTTTSVIPTVASVQINDVTVQTGLVPYIRSIPVEFQASGLKPFTQFYAFFDSSNVSYACKPQGTQTGAFDDPTTTLGQPLITNGLGVINGWFLIPPIDADDSLQFKTGTRVFCLTDDPNDDASATSYATANYVAQGVIQTEQETITSTVTAEVQTTSVSQSQTLVSSNTSSSTTIQSGTEAGVYIDPLAQSFLISFIDENNNTPAGVFISKIDLYFLTSDPTLPFTFQIREMQNGTPTQTIVPFSEVQVYPYTGTYPPQTPLQTNTCYVSIDASLATTVVMQAPVFLQNGVEYCFVLISNSNQYQVYTATLGGTMINSDRIISQQPYAGVLFESKNASTWTPNQIEDIMFTIYRCVFDTNTAGATVYFTNDVVPAYNLVNNPFEFSKGSNLIRVLHNWHGKPNGGQVLITIPTTEYGNSYNGVPATSITPNLTATTPGTQVFTVSNVQLNSYMIQIPTPSTFATSSGRTGPSGATASDDMAMDIMDTVISQLLFGGTNIIWNAELTTTQSVGGSQSAFNKDSSYNSIIINNNNYFTVPRIIASATNEAAFITGNTTFAQKSLVLQANLTTTSSGVSPVIDTTRTSVITIQQLIDNDNVIYNNVNNFDNEQENNVTGTDISFDGTTNSIGWSSSNFSAYADALGQYIQISGSSVSTNNCAYPTLAKIIGIDLTNDIISIDPTTLQLTTHAAGDTITIGLFTGFTDETAPEGGSSPEKYICKEAILQTPANTLTVYLTLMWPPAATVTVYYKILPPYSTATWYTLPWTQMQLDPASYTALAANSQDFEEYQWTAPSIGDFTAFAIKIVYKSVDSTQVPQCSAFRAIALTQ